MVPNEFILYNFTYFSSVTAAFGHLIEIYDFPSELITRDLLAAFREYK